MAEASWVQLKAWSQKCSEMASQRPPGNNSRPRPRNAPKSPPRGLLGAILGLDPEMHRNCFPEASWWQFSAWPQKCSEMVSQRPPGGSFRPGHRNSPKWPLGFAKRVFRRRVVNTRRRFIVNSQGKPTTNGRCKPCCQSVSRSILYGLAWGNWRKVWRG